MIKVEYKDLTVDMFNVVCATTTTHGYDVTKEILIEKDIKDPVSGEWYRYVILTGSHCSCYGWDETEWEAIAYTASELESLATAAYNLKEPFWVNFRRYLEI